MTIAVVTKAIRKKLIAGLEAAITTHSQAYLDAVTDLQTTPIGTKKRHGTEYNGQTVERSDNGEYPRVEFDLANKGIRSGVNRPMLEGRSGVTEDGMELVHLSEGSHPANGEPYERLGMVQIFEEFLTDIGAAAQAAMEAEPGT